MKRLIQTLLLLLLPLTASALSPETTAQIEADWAREEKVTRKRAITDPRALEGVILRGRRMIADMKAHGAADEAATAARILDETEKLSRVDGAKMDALYTKARWAVRALTFANPKLDFNEIVFVKRQWPRNNHQCSHRVGEAQSPGAQLCILSGLSPEGKVRMLLDEKYSMGGIGRFDLSYDAKRLVFPYAKPRATPTRYGSGQPGVRGGACHMYDLYEVHIDGTGLRALTRNPDSEDTEPIYLPDDRIAFTTSRDNRFVQCGDWALVCGLYSMAPDGSDLRRITEPKEGEFYPNMLDDGRIMYTRWDYVMKGYNVIQQLWSVNPDGRRAALLFGDHYAFSHGPIAFMEARQIPGTNKVMCTGAAHHNTGAGPLMILDLDQNRGTRSSMVNITPEIGYPEINPRVLTEITYEQLPGKGISNTQNDTGWYSSPYPLSEQHFLVVYSFEKNNAAAHGYGLYLMDIHQNRELILRFEDASCYSPVPLRPRKRPRVIPDLVRDLDPHTPGTLLVTDVYQGLEGVKRGEARHLRILETHPKTVHTSPQRCDVGVNSGWDMRGVLGTVPIEEDGSIHFEVPPHKALFFEVLDKDYLEIRRMRNFMNVMPGEVNSCVGCHEPYGKAPVSTESRTLMAMNRAPSKIIPPPWGTDGFSFKKTVQPILDEKCTSCHDGSTEEGMAFDLRGHKMRVAPAGYDRDQGPQHMVSDAFLNLLEYVSYIRVGGYQGEKLPLSVNATGSRQSKLMKVLAKDHHKVALEIGEWRALAAWIDCNAPYYGSWDEIVLPDAKVARNKSSTRKPVPLRPLSSLDRARISSRIKELEAADTTQILAYVDCGLQVDSGGETPGIRQIRGQPYSFRTQGSPKKTPASQTNITYDQKELVFEISGLKARKDLALTLTWWDFNNAGRTQSVWISAKPGGKAKQLREPTLLPAWQKKQQPPETISVPIPPGLLAGDKLFISIKNEGGVNAVLGEMWVTHE